jgi:hypothetical protein
MNGPCASRRTGAFLLLHRVVNLHRKRVRIMIACDTQTVYQAFGLRLASEIPLRELLPAADQESAADATIRLTDLSEAWSARESGDDYYAFRGDELLLRVPDTAVFSIRGGNRIGVHPAPGADESAIRLYLLGTCIGALLIQRQTLPLHGSAVVIDGKAYAFVGDSGAGKSTLAAAFVNLGYPLLSDDVIAVLIRRDRAPIALPAYPQQKLWLESLDGLGMEADRYVPIYESKYAVPVPARFCSDPVPLAGVFELTITDAGNADIRPLQGLTRLPTLQYHTFRRFLIPPWGLERWHFATSAAIAGRVGMYRLSRPAAGFAVHDLVSLILQTAEEGEKIPQQ